MKSMTPSSSARASVAAAASCTAATAHSTASSPRREGQILDIGAEDIDDLRLHGVADIFSLAADGAGRADAAAGRHGGNVPGQGDKGSGAAGLGRGRCDIYHDRHRRGQHILHDLLGDINAAAGGVQAQDHRLSRLQLRVFDCAAEVLTQHRRHRPAERPKQEQGRSPLAKRSPSPGQANRRGAVRESWPRAHLLARSGASPAGDRRDRRCDRALSAVFRFADACFFGGV